jgi:hypothetical protein
VSDTKAGRRCQTRRGDAVADGGIRHRRHGAGAASQRVGGGGIPADGGFGDRGAHHKADREPPSV